MQVNIEKYKNIPFIERELCDICEKESDTSIISLPNLPLTEIYTSDKIDDKVGVVDQGLDLCTNCGHAQLRNVVDVELQYGETFSYFFRTSESASAKSSVDFFLKFMDRTSKGKQFDHILEVGCNDLYLLKKLEHRANSLTGIDPILKDFTDDLSKSKINAIGEFFENVELERTFDLLICKDALEHVDNPKEFTRKIVDEAADNTIFYFQFPCLESTLKDLRFDQIFHQHLNYFTVQSVIHMLNQLDCELIDIEFNYEHWGALLVAFKKGNYKGKFDKDIWKITPENVIERFAIFKKEMQSVNARLEYFKGETIYGYGAALMLPVLSYFLENDFSKFECIVDDDKRKNGLYYINLPVPIKGRDAIKDERNSIFLLTAIASLTNVRSMLPNLFQLRPKHVIVPLSTL